MPLYLGPDGLELKIEEARIGTTQFPHPPYYAAVLEWQGHKLMLTKNEIVEIVKMLSRASGYIDAAKQEN